MAATCSRRLRWQLMASSFYRSIRHYIYGTPKVLRAPRTQDELEFPNLALRTFVQT